MQHPSTLGLVVPLVLVFFACEAPPSRPLLGIENAIVKAPIEPRLEVFQDSSQAMLQAAREGDLKSLEQLLKRGCDPNVETFGRTPLLSAAAFGYATLVDRLLAAGAEVDRAGQFGRTALHEAASSGSCTVVRALLEAGASPTCPDDVGLTPLHLAAQEGQALVLDLLVRGGYQRRTDTDLDVRSSWGTTTLHEAAAAGSTLCVEWLCSYRGPLKCELDARDGLRRTPLHLTALRGDVATYQVLAKAGADVSAVDVFDVTAQEYLRDRVKHVIGPSLEETSPIELPLEWDGEKPLLYRWRDAPPLAKNQALLHL